MYSILVKNGYWTGGAIDKRYGFYETGVDMDEIPYEADFEKRQAYKYEQGKLVFDAVKWAEIEAEKTAIDDSPTTEERLEALESAMLEMILGGSEE